LTVIDSAFGYLMDPAKEASVSVRHFFPVSSPTKWSAAYTFRRASRIPAECTATARASWSAYMMRIVAQRFQVFEARFRKISTKSVAPRLARELVRLLPQIGWRVNNVLEINLSQEELAQMKAATVFTVSRLLTRWEKQGNVSVRPRIVMIQNLLYSLGLSELG
jgi:hypothetical protein